MSPSMCDLQHHQSRSAYHAVQKGHTSLGTFFLCPSAYPGRSSLQTSFVAAPEAHSQSLQQFVSSRAGDSTKCSLQPKWTPCTFLLSHLTPEPQPCQVNAKSALQLSGSLFFRASAAVNPRMYFHLGVRRVPLEVAFVSREYPLITSAKYLDF